MSAVDSAAGVIRGRGHVTGRGPRRHAHGGAVAREAPDDLSGVVGEVLAGVAAVDVADEGRVNVVPEQLRETFG